MDTCRHPDLFAFGHPGDPLLQGHHQVSQMADLHGKRAQGSHLCHLWIHTKTAVGSWGAGEANIG